MCCWLGRNGLVLDGGQVSQAMLSAMPVEGPSDSRHESRTQLGAGGLGAMVLDLVQTRVGVLLFMATLSLHEATRLMEPAR